MPTNNAAESSSKDCDRLDDKIRAREAVEEHLKMKMSQSSGNLLPSADNAASILKRKMSKSMPSKSSIIYRRLESFEYRVNKKMSKAVIVHTVNATLSIESQKMTEEGSYKEHIKRETNGSAAVLNNNAMRSSSKDRG